MSNLFKSESQVGNKPATLLFFWDYDTQWGADRSRSAGGAKSWGPLEFAYTERLLELHTQYNVPACFAVVGAAALPGVRPYHDPAQIKRIHESGHEIGSHAFKHEWLPGLNRRELLETLRLSKDALEQCTGAEVVSFVPPYNQPFDYPAKWAISLSERRTAGRDRTDLTKLCVALGESGYRFCRIAYSPLPVQLIEKLIKGKLVRKGLLETIANVTCARLNTPGGFTEPALRLLQRSAKAGGVIVVYGHPHSLRSGNAQDEKWLVPFLQEVQALREQGLVRVCLPRDLVGITQLADASLARPELVAS
jgi:peptidoglycan/xylan/chitin deacetylase (PgdA/CDA1 family)